MKKLIVIANDAQSCGKTSAALILKDYLGRKGVKARLAVTSPEQELPCAYDLLDVEEGIKPSEVVDLIDGADAVIIDVHTEGHDRFAEFFRRSDMDDVLNDVDTELTVIIPVCDDAEVLRAATDVAEAFAGRGDFLVLRSPLLADVPSSWEGSQAQKALRLLGATVLDMPALPEAVLDELDGLEVDVPLALTQKSLLPRFVKTELMQWEVNFCENLRDAENCLLPQRAKVEDFRTDSIYGKTLAIK